MWEIYVGRIVYYTGDTELYRGGAVAEVIEYTIATEHREGVLDDVVVGHQ